MRGWAATWAIWKLEKKFQWTRTFSKLLEDNHANLMALKAKLKLDQDAGRYGGARLGTEELTDDGHWPLQSLKLMPRAEQRNDFNAHIPGWSVPLLFQYYDDAHTVKSTFAGAMGSVQSMKAKEAINLK